MLVILQARTNSKRFKGKVLVNIYGFTIIEHIINRLKKSKKIKKIVVATSTQGTDNKLATHLNQKKIQVFRGNLNNVAQRLCKAATKYKAKYFIRISGDSPLIDRKIVERAIQLFKKEVLKPDILTNIFPRSFPKGQSVEIIKTKILKDNLKKFTRFDKEHVTTFFYKNPKRFDIKNFELKQGKSYIKLSIDNKKDLINIKKKYSKKQFLNFKIL